MKRITASLYDKPVTPGIPEVPAQTGSDKAITAFDIMSPVIATGFIDEGTKTIAVTIPYSYGTAVTSLIPTIKHTGVSVSPPSDTAQDFTGSVSYTVTAADGSTETYTVMVTVASTSDKAITGFNITSPVNATGSINEGAKTIAVAVPYGTVLTGLTTAITHTGASINPASGAVQNFTSSVFYIVAAEDGSTVTYTVTVTVTSVLNTVEAITDYLNTAAEPVSLPVHINLADPSPNGWTGLLDVIAAVNKTVNLDLSACTMTGTEFDPNYMISTGKNKIVSLILPIAAESIRAGTDSNYTFQHFTALTGVTGVNIETIGQYTFIHRTTLTSANFLNATTIGQLAFFGCTSLTAADFPAVETIVNSAFVNCTSLTSVSLPSLTNLGQQAFQGCTGLSSVNLPASLTTIGNNPFVGCTGLTITVDAGNPNYKAESGMLLNYAGTTLIGWPAATGTVSLPGITNVGYMAFRGCTGLVSADLSNAAIIGIFAFEDCTALTAVNLPAATSIWSAFQSTGTTPLTVTLGASVPASLGEIMFLGVNAAKPVTIEVPSAATAWSGIIAGSPYSGTDTTDNWGNGFRGGGWNGTNLSNSTYVNSNITLIVVTY
jgi:hypothetical protein